MSESIHLDPGLSKPEQLNQLYHQIENLVAAEDDFVANLANILSVLKYELDVLWVGCYFVKGDQLVLGPFQGPLACTRINYGKGVCGTSWERNETVVVPNVHEFEGHIACSSKTNSEIVLPLRKNGNVIGVLDVDSEAFERFDKDDRAFLEKVSELISKLYE